MAVPGMTVDSAEEMAVDPVPIKLTITGEEEGEFSTGHNTQLLSWKIDHCSGLGLQQTN